MVDNKAKSFTFCVFLFLNIFSCNAGFRIVDSKDHLEGPVIGIDFERRQFCVVNENIDKELENKKEIKPYHFFENFDRTKLKGLAQAKYYNSLARCSEVLGIRSAAWQKSHISSNLGIDMTIWKPDVNFSKFQTTSCLLAKMKYKAETFLKRKVKSAVIAVPFYQYDPAYAKKIQSACRKIGIEHVCFQQNFYAATLASGFFNPCTNQVTVVCNLSGACELAIVDQNKDLVKINSSIDQTYWEQHFNDAFSRYFKRACKKQSGIDLNRNLSLLHYLRTTIADAQDQLSKVTEVEVEVEVISPSSFLNPRYEFTFKLTRKEFEYSVNNLLLEVARLCERLIKSHKLDTNKIDKVILVGGMTKMPKFKEIIEHMFDQPAHCVINPDEVVAMGSAIQGTQPFSLMCYPV